MTYDEWKLEAPPQDNNDRDNDLILECMGCYDILHIDNVHPYFIGGKKHKVCQTCFNNLTK